MNAKGNTLIPHPHLVVRFLCVYGFCLPCFWLNRCLFGSHFDSLPNKGTSLAGTRTQFNRPVFLLCCLSGVTIVSWRAFKQHGRAGVQKHLLRLQLTRLTGLLTHPIPRAGNGAQSNLELKPTFGSSRFHLQRKGIPNWGAAIVNTSLYPNEDLIRLIEGTQREQARLSFMIVMEHKVDGDRLGGVIG